MRTATNSPDKTRARRTARPPLRPIRDDKQLREAIDLAMALSERAEHAPPHPEELNYLNVLTILIEHYEDRYHPIPATGRTPLETLKSLLDSAGMTGSDLGRLLGHRQLGAAILRGDRQLSKTHIRQIADHFHIDPAALL